MHNVPPPPDPRGAKAVTILDANAWKTFLDGDGRVSYSIPSTATAHRYYRTTDNGCTCDDLRYRPWVACKHMLACRLYEQRLKEEVAF